MVPDLWARIYGRTALVTFNAPNTFVLQTSMLVATFSKLEDLLKLLKGFLRSLELEYQIYHRAAQICNLRRFLKGAE